MRSAVTGMRKRLLLVASDFDLRAKIARALHSSGFAVELSSNEKRTLKLAENYSFPLAIVASRSFSPPNPAMMRELRNFVPEIIVVTRGADEVAQASNESALIAQVREIMSSKNGSYPTPKILFIANSRLDLAGHVFVDAEGREVALTRGESDLLAELAHSPCEVVSRDNLSRAVSGRGSDSFDRSVDMLVARLRRKIEADPKDPRLIVTVKGIGYKLAVWRD